MLCNKIKLEIILFLKFLNECFGLDESINTTDCSSARNRHRNTINTQPSSSITKTKTKVKTDIDIETDFVVV